MSVKPENHGCSYIDAGDVLLAPNLLTPCRQKKLKLLVSSREPQLGIGRAARGVLVARHDWNCLWGKLAVLARLGRANLGEPFQPGRQVPVAVSNRVDLAARLLP